MQVRKQAQRTLHIAELENSSIKIEVLVGVQAHVLITLYRLAPKIAVFFVDSIHLL